MKRRFIYFFAFVFGTSSLYSCSETETVVPVTNTATTAATESFIYPDKTWKDTDGNVINAHSAGLYYENGTYYWFGESKLIGYAESSSLADAGIRVYESTDLINWKNDGLVMSVDYNNADSDIAYGCRIQRPKIVYNKSTKKYVAIFKLYLKGQGVNVGYNGVATADNVTGPYTFKGKFLAASSVNGSGDFALVQEPNGDLYHFTVRKSDRAFVKAKMSCDYFAPATPYTQCTGVASNTEGPAMFFKDGVYHLLGSGSTGWDPNPPRYYTSTSIDGPWTVQSNPLLGTNNLTGLTGFNKTYGGQPTYIQKIEGTQNQYIALFDVWMPTAPTTSRYIWLPFRVNANNKLSMTWIGQWNLDWFDTN